MPTPCSVCAGESAPDSRTGRRRPMPTHGSSRRCSSAGTRRPTTPARSSPGRWWGFRSIPTALVRQMDPPVPDEPARDERPSPANDCPPDATVGTEEARAARRIGAGLPQPPPERQRVPSRPRQVQPGMSLQRRPSSRPAPPPEPGRAGRRQAVFVRWRKRTGPTKFVATVTPRSPLPSRTRGTRGPARPRRKPRSITHRSTKDQSGTGNPTAPAQVRKHHSLREPGIPREGQGVFRGPAGCEKGDVGQDAPAHNRKRLAAIRSDPH